MSDCYVHDMRKARKLHRCCECHGSISPGETYHSHHGIWEGEAYTCKVCPDCETLRSECDRGAPHGERTPFEGLHDAVDELWGSSPELLVQFVAIKRRRGAAVPMWMAARADAAVRDGGQVKLQQIFKQTTTKTTEGELRCQISKH